MKPLDVQADTERPLERLQGDESTQLTVKEAALGALTLTEVLLRDRRVGWHG